MTQALGFNIDDFTFAEAYQMYCEKGRSDWQHTAYIAAHIIEANRGKAGRPTKPAELNPWESVESSQSVKLTKENFHLLRGLANGR